MDTLGVCGAPSIAADNGVVMVKEPRIVRSVWKPGLPLDDVRVMRLSGTERKIGGGRARGKLF